MSSAQSLTFVEIDVDRCSLTYGSSPCTASIPATGDRKCFNSLGTCQDRANFDNEPVTIRFAVDASYLPGDIECIPCLTNVDFSPSVVSLGVDLGQRASVKVTCKDHPDSDTGPYGDPYLADRDYDPYRQGTFFGKFRARNPYLRGRNLRLIRGVVGQSLAEMETRHFIIESFDGPLPDGSFSITAKDVLKLADGDRAQAPVLSNGFLQSGITASATSLVLSPAGIGNAEYPASGTAAIGGKEIVTFTRSGDNVTITARAQYNTTAVAHEAQDRFQVCLVYEGEDPADIVADLLENYAGVDPAYIPISEWQAETNAFLQRLYTTCIPEPVAVSTLLKELIEQAALALAWDDAAQVIKLQVLRGVLTDAQRFTEDNYIEGTIESREQPDKRVSRVWTYFGMINPLRPIDEPDNYRSSAETIDEDTERDYGAQAIKKIFSRWIPENGRAVAERLNAIILARYKVPPRRFNLDLWRDGEYEPKLLAGARLEGWFIQDDAGAAIDVPVQVVRVNPQPERFKVEAEEMLFDVPANFNDRIITIDVSTLNFNLRAAYDNIYPPPDDDTEVICRIAAGAIVGSASVSSPAFTVGDWPSGTIITIEIEGRIQGRGGDGGAGGTGVLQPGQAGGDALYTRRDITISGSGEIYGGGGGGGAGGATLSFYSGVLRGGDGGGGQGYLPGSRGAVAATPEARGAGAGGPGANSVSAGGAGGSIAHSPTLQGQTGQTGYTNGPYVGSPGGAGGAAGRAIDGNSYVTETGSLTIIGARVN